MYIIIIGSVTPSDASPSMSFGSPRDSASYLHQILENSARDLRRFLVEKHLRFLVNSNQFEDEIHITNSNQPIKYNKGFASSNKNNQRPSSSSDSGQSISRKLSIAKQLSRERKPSQAWVGNDEFAQQKQNMNISVVEKKGVQHNISISSSFDLAHSLIKKQSDIKHDSNVRNSSKSFKDQEDLKKSDFYHDNSALGKIDSKDELQEEPKTDVFGRRFDSSGSLYNQKVGAFRVKRVESPKDVALQAMLSPRASSQRIRHPAGRSGELCQFLTQYTK